MSVVNTISPDKLSRRNGTPNCPALIDVPAAAIAFDRWCRDATDETHTWPTTKPEPAR